MHPAAGNIAGDSRRTDAANSTSRRLHHLTSTDASSFLSRFASSARNGDRARCLESASRLISLSIDSNRNHSLLSSAGAACVLAAAFRSFAGGGDPVLKEILSALVLFFPIEDEEVFRDIGSPESLDSIVSILGSGNSRLNALLVLKEIASFDADLARAAARIDGLIEALMSVIRDPISPRSSSSSSKVSLAAAFHIVASADEWIAERFVKMGLVDLALECLVDSESERKMSEAALAAFDRVCGCEMGREKAYGNALTVPVLVVRMFRVSNLATEFAVSSLWKLCKNWKGGETVGCVVELLEGGVFVKLLSLLQLGCSKVARDRATKLLKFLNDYGAGLGCVDSMDFRGLDRPF